MLCYSFGLALLLEFEICSYGGEALVSALHMAGLFSFFSVAQILPPLLFFQKWAFTSYTSSWSFANSFPCNSQADNVYQLSKLSKKPVPSKEAAAALLWLFVVMWEFWASIACSNF